MVKNTPSVGQILQNTLEELGKYIQAQFESGNFAVARNLSKKFEIKISQDLIVKRPRGFQESRKADVSVVVVTHQQTDQFTELLSQLNEYVSQGWCELIVVDNGNKYLKYNDSEERFYTYLSAGVNLGISAARNIGFAYAHADYVITIDDDGVLGPGALDALVDTMTKYDAVVVRGKVLPRTSISEKPEHYDKGDKTIPTYIDVEGITIWRKHAVINANGFDALLYGHEGFELFARMFSYYGPHKFLYEPKAILYHDYYSCAEKKVSKTRRHEFNDTYLSWLGIQQHDLMRSMNQFQSDQTTKRMFAACIENIASLSNSTSDNKVSKQPLVSIITIAKNAEQFLDDYTRSLQQQTYAQFEVMFVDDASDDKTAAKISELWEHDQRLKLIRTNGGGRSAALNLALENASGDICMFANVNDISTLHRVEYTVNYFVRNPDSSCVAFFVFNEQAPYHDAGSLVDQPVSIRTRRYVGIPVSFPSFSFRKSHFTERFNSDLTAGVEYDWLYKNLDMNSADGHLIPLSLVYSRSPDGNIQADRMGNKTTEALNHVVRAHESLLGELTKREKELISILIGYEDIRSVKEVAELWEYILRFTDQIGPDTNLPVSRVRAYLSARVTELEVQVLRNISDGLVVDVDEDMAKYQMQLFDIAHVVCFINSRKPGGLFRKAKTLFNVDVGYSVLKSYLEENNLKVPAPANFSSEKYLKANADVARAVSSNAFPNAYTHYFLHGINEDRIRPMP